jgi:hypothetical protein
MLRTTPPRSVVSRTRAVRNHITDLHATGLLCRV